MRLKTRYLDVMAETLDVPYHEVVKAAIIPAILYFGSAFWMVHLEAGRLGLSAYFRSETTPIEDDHLPFLDAGIPVASASGKGTAPETAPAKGGRDSTIRQALCCSRPTCRRRE